MPGTIKAVTVSVNYIERKKWSVKLLSVETRKDATLYWKVRATVATSEDKDLMLLKASDVAIHHGIPFIVNRRNGDNLNDEDTQTLNKYGVAVE